MVYIPDLLTKHWLKELLQTPIETEAKTLILNTDIEIIDIPDSKRRNQMFPSHTDQNNVLFKH